MIIKLIAAICKENRGIGYNNSIPWRCKEDMKFFSEITRGKGNNGILMGSNTWRSLSRPLKNRKNIVVGKTVEKQEGIEVFADINLAIEYGQRENLDILWIIGGSKIYETMLVNYENLIDECIITSIPGNYTCDTFFPELTNWNINKTEILGNYTIEVNYYEKKYLNINIV